MNNSQENEVAIKLAKNYTNLPKNKAGFINWKKVKEEIWNDYCSSNIPPEYRKPNLVTDILNILKIRNN